MRKRGLPKRDCCDGSLKGHGECSRLPRDLGENGTIEPGARVLVEFPNRDQRLLTILRPAEIHAATGVISTRSPVAQALRGHAAGEEVEVRAPGGSYRLKIISVETK